MKKKEKSEKRGGDTKRLCTNNDYEKAAKFNYRNGYLRDDRVPAFISTAFHYQSHQTKPASVEATGGGGDKTEIVSDHMHYGSNV